MLLLMKSAVGKELSIFLLPQFKEVDMYDFYFERHRSTNTNHVIAPFRYVFPHILILYDIDIY